MSNQSQISVELSLALQEFYAGLTKLQTDFGAAMKGMGSSASASGRELDNAFGVVGVRSSAKIQAEIREIDVALQKLGMDTRVSGQEFDRAWSAGQAKLAGLQAELNGAHLASNRAASGAGLLGTHMGALGGIASSVGPMIAAAFGAQHFIEVNTQAESLRRCLVQLTGSQQAAAAEMDYIRGAANRMGLEVQTAASSYMSLMASTRGTALEGEQTRRIFEAVAGAMGMLGKSSAETNNALRAVEQMANKGTVSMEDLRGQLGEALPGALKAAADGMGVSTQKLIEMVSAGDVLAKDLLPRLADGLEKTYGTTGKVEGFAAAWNRLKNSIDNVFTNIGQSGVMTTLANGLDSLAVKVNSAWLGFETLGKGLGILAGGVMTLTNPTKALGEMLDENRKKAMLAGETFGKQGEALDELRKKYGLTQAEIDKLNGKQAASVPASQAAGRAASEAAAAQAKMTDRLKEAVSQSERAAKASSTYAEAVKQSGANAVMVAGMFGTEAQAREASAKAAEDYAAAVKKDLESQEQVLAAKQQLLEQLQQEAAKSGELSQKKREEIKALEDGIVTQTAAVAKARELAEASDLSARKAELASETYGNQSAQLKEYAQAVEAAQKALEKLTADEAAGLATKEQVKSAEIELAHATALYRDALSDATKAAELHVQQLGRQASLEQAQLGVVRARYQAIYEVAKAQGREGEAAQAMLAIRRVEIQMQEAQAKASRAQADAIITAAKAKEAELAASGKLTEAARAEIEARIQEAEVKKLEAEKAEILAQKLRELANTEDDVRRKGDGAADGLRDSLSGAADASDRLNSSLRSRPSSGGGGGGGSVSTGGAGDGSGNGVIKNPGAPSLSPTTKSGPASYSELKTDWEKVARSKFGLRGDEVAEFMKIIDGISKDEDVDALSGYHGPGTTDGMLNALHGAFERAGQKAADQAKAAVNRAKNAASGNQDRGGFFPGLPSPRSSVQHTINLNIGGHSTQVNVSSEDDAKALIAALSTAAGVSS